MMLIYREVYSPTARSVATVVARTISGPLKSFLSTESIMQDFATAPIYPPLYRVWRDLLRANPLYVALCDYTIKDRN